MPYHLDAVTQLAGTIALDFADAMAERVARLREERGRVIDGLTQLDVDVVPSEANFVLFRPNARDGNDVWQGLLDRSVLIRNCACLLYTSPSPRDATLSRMPSPA